MTLNTRLGKLERVARLDEGLLEDREIYLCGPDDSICVHFCTIRAKQTRQQTIMEGTADVQTPQ